MAVPMSKVGKKSRKLLRKLYQDKCAYCGRELTNNTFTVDHVVAQSHGGHSNFRNLKPSCKFCNYLKGKCTIDEFRVLLEMTAKCNTDDAEKIRKVYEFDNGKVIFYFEKLNKSQDFSLREMANFEIMSSKWLKL